MRYYLCNIEMTYETSLKQYVKHVEHYYATCETLPMQHCLWNIWNTVYAIYETHETWHMQQCLMFMHDDAHDQVLVAFNI
jgi:hypothetical protein